LKHSPTKNLFKFQQNQNNTNTRQNDRSPQRTEKLTTEHSKQVKQVNIVDWTLETNGNAKSTLCAESVLFFNILTMV
jgi:hypothetical protein